MIYAASVLVSFVAVFLKVFQHKNVIGNHIRIMVITSYLMAAFDVASVVLIVKGGWFIAITAGTGAAAGAVVAVKLHNRLFNK